MPSLLPCQRDRIMTKGTGEGSLDLPLSGSPQAQPLGPGPDSASESRASSIAESMLRSRRSRTSTFTAARGGLGAVSRKSSWTWTSKALAMRSIFSADGKRFWISILPTMVVEQPTRSANTACEMPVASLRRFMFLASKALALLLVDTETPCGEGSFARGALCLNNPLDRKL